MDRAELEQLYERETGLRWSESDGPHWMRAHWHALDLDLKTHFYEHYLSNSIYLDLPSKYSLLLQRPCLICAPEGRRAIISFRIRPESAQYLSSKRKKAFKLAIADRIEKFPHIEPFHGKICLTVFYVCSSQSRTRDVDNMTKLLLDSIKGKIIPDDREVDHLSLARAVHDGDFEYVGLAIQNSNFNNNNDVIDTFAYDPTHIWPELRIEDFLSQVSGTAETTDDDR